MIDNESTDLRVVDGGQTGPWIVEQHKLPFRKGKPKIFRTRKSGAFWSFSMWISEEEKYYIKSLKTDDLNDALDKAEQVYIEVQTTVKEGRKATKISLPVMIDRYLDHQQNRVTKRLIKADRFGTIKSRVNILLRFFPKNKSVFAIKGNDFMAYTQFRQDEGVQLYTIVQERAELKSFFKWALHQTYISPHQLPVFEEIRNVRANKRTDFLWNEYMDCFRALKRMTDNEANQRRKKDIEIFRDFFLIMGNSGIRFAEMRRIKWYFIQRTYKIKSEDAHPDGVADIYLPADVTKTGVDRTVVATAVPYLKRLRDLYDDPKPSDFLFANPNNGKSLSKQFYYRHWDMMLKEAGLEDRFPKLTIYSLRHYYATRKMLKGVPIYDLSLTLGCSVVYIEQHYSHVRSPQVAERITRLAPKNKSLIEAIPF
jgi:integrase